MYEKEKEIIKEKKYYGIFISEAVYQKKIRLGDKLNSLHCLKYDK